MRGSDEVISIYVVDDDDAVRDSLEALLVSEGFTVKLFASADSFLAGLAENQESGGGDACLLLDLHMPGTDGHELMTILGVRKIDIPVVVMTGNAYERTRSRAFRMGAAAFLEKPFDTDMLISTIRTALARR